MVLDGSLPFSASPTGGGMLPSDIRLGNITILIATMEEQGRHKHPRARRGMRE